MTSTSGTTQKARFDAGEARVAVVIPCYNEEMTVGSVVRDFAEQLPAATIYVFDNNSTDRTLEEAIAAGAVVFSERRQGKGYVVQSMFRRVEADIYVMVDGDGTYPAAAVHSLIVPVATRAADMVIGSRLHAESRSEFHVLNRVGNRLYRRLINTLFRQKITDFLSGYRVFSRRLVRGVPLYGGGFETEAELTIKVLQRGYEIVEVPVDLGIRPRGSSSKIRIVRDGFLILNMILTLVRDYKPLTFFGGLGLMLVLSAGVPLLLNVLRMTSLSLVAVTALAVILGFSGVLAISVGLILHTTTRHFQELESQLQTMSEELRRHQRD